MKPENCRFRWRPKYTIKGDVCMHKQGDGNCPSKNCPRNKPNRYVTTEEVTR